MTSQPNDKCASHCKLCPSVKIKPPHNSNSQIGGAVNINTPLNVRSTSTTSPKLSNNDTCTSKRRLGVNIKCPTNNSANIQAVAFCPITASSQNILKPIS